MHGGFRGTSRDRQREYFVEPVVLDGSPVGWWAVTSSEHVTERRLVGSAEGAVLVATAWETEYSRSR